MKPTLSKGFRHALLLSAGVVSIGAFAPRAAFAQSTATQVLEEIVVTATQRKEIIGVMSAETVAKSRSTVSAEYLQTQTSGQSIINSINLLPGVSFTNSDSYGSSGGNLRLRGFDNNRISLTWDGMPTNDTGNYAIFTNQQLDPEIIDRAAVNLGTTDVDSPTAAATGGTINVLTRRPGDTIGFRTTASVGTDDYRRIFGMVDTGALGSLGTSAFLSASYQKYDKFKGPGTLEKKQVNGRVYQTFGDNGDFISIAGHYNVNRNNFYRNITLAELATFGYGFDNFSSCVRAPVVAGTASNDGATTATFPNFTAPGTPAAQNQITGSTNDPSTAGACTNFFGLRINPSNTGNVRAQSKWTFNDNFTFTFDPWFQYVLANGGGTTVVSETDQRLRGANNAAGRDLNGDGDTLDSVRLYTPNTTNTRRNGVTSSLIYRIDDMNVVRAAFTRDYGKHRQTGQFTQINADGTPQNIFGGLKGTPVKTADGADLRGRDRFSVAELNQIAFNYDGKFDDGRFGVSIGVRNPYFKRDLNQYCYTQVSNNNQTCTTQTVVTTLADGTVTFPSSATVNFVKPYSRTLKYDKILPNVGLSFKPSDEQQIYASYAKGFAAPRTDNLYSFSIQTVQPEGTNSFDLGYRYQTSQLVASTAIWKSNFSNRIVSSFDPDTRLSIDRNVGPVKLWGWDGEIGVEPVENWTVYGSASYNHSRVQKDIAFNATVTVPSSGKRLVETPDWTFAARSEYKIGDFTIGGQMKRISKRYSTDDNGESVPGFTVVDANASYSFASLGAEGVALKFNVNNLFDKKYLGNIATTRFSVDTTKAYGNSGATFFGVGGRQTFQMSLAASF